MKFIDLFSGIGGFRTALEKTDTSVLLILKLTSMLKNLTKLFMIQKTKLI